MSTTLEPIIETISDSKALDRPAELVAWVGRGSPRTVARRAQAFLGHPVHPAFTDLPIGFWTSAWFLDLLPGRGSTEPAARTLIGLGLLSTVPAIASGLGDAADLPLRERRLSAAHASLNVAATAAYAVSWWMRRRQTTRTARLVAHVGAALATGQAQIAERVGTSQVHVGRLIATSLTSLRELVEESAA
jgi:hypothetical protein